MEGLGPVAARGHVNRPCWVGGWPATRAAGPPPAKMPGARAALALLLAVSLAAGSGGCSIRKMVAGKIGDGIAQGGSVYTTDDDPQLVREAIPFGLKTIESLLEIVPKHQGLLLAACQGFAQYAYAFVEADAEALADTDRQAAEAARARALKLYLRARDYGLRGLEARHRGITERLRRDPEAAVAKLGRKDLPLLFWTAGAWGQAIAAGLDHPALVADLGAVNAMMRRSLAIDEGYMDGAIHEAMIVVESVPEFMGGSPERAREHFRRAIALSDSENATPYVMLASSVSVAQQDRGEFERLLHRALAIDPDARPESRLETLIGQQRARRLLAREDELFLEAEPTEGDTLR
jgi:predicted anti-sigma-YlaC factor YlaD